MAPALGTKVLPFIAVAFLCVYVGRGVHDARRSSPSTILLETLAHLRGHLDESGADSKVKKPHRQVQLTEDEEEALGNLEAEKRSLETYGRPIHAPSPRRPPEMPYKSNPVPAVLPPSFRLRDKLSERIVMDEGVVQVARREERALRSKVYRGILGPLRFAFGRSLQKTSSVVSLTLANTEPLKIVVNWNNFFPETARPHTTCFAAGDWSFTGNVNPGPYPPPSTSRDYPVCDFETYSYFDKYNVECWYKCKESDVLDSDGFEWLKLNVEKAVKKLEAIYRVPKVDGAVVFKKSNMVSKGAANDRFWGLSFVLWPKTLSRSKRRKR